MNVIEQLYKVTKGLTLLFVEDDEQLRIKMASMFDELFKRVDIAENGKEGLNKYQESLQKDKRPYDLVITDINMPEMNGMDMIRAIYEHRPLQPIIVVSAHNESDYLLELLHLGINSFLIKPIKHDDLVNTLYKVSKEMSNERLIERYYRQIEDLNKELSQQSKALKISNDDLHKKNIALEKSMRIMEGMHHKDKLHKNIISKPLNVSGLQTKELFKEHALAEENFLEDIEQLISDIVHEHSHKKIEERSFQTLSKAVSSYADSLGDIKIYAKLKSRFNALGIALNRPPKNSGTDDFERALSILESFFFIYEKWQHEWKNIADDKFEAFSSSMESEILMIIDVWENKR